MLRTEWVGPEVFEGNVSIASSEKVDSVSFNVVADSVLAPSGRHLAAAINRHARIAAIHNAIPHCLLQQ